MGRAGEIGGAGPSGKMPLPHPTSQTALNLSPFRPNTVPLRGNSSDLRGLLLYDASTRFNLSSQLLVPDQTARQPWVEIKGSYGTLFHFFHAARPAIATPSHHGLRKQRRSRFLMSRFPLVVPLFCVALRLVGLVKFPFPDSSGIFALVPM